LDHVVVDVDEAARALTIIRGSIVVLVNLGAVPHHFAVGAVEMLAASHSGVRSDESGVTVPSDAVAIVRHNCPPQ
jgi:hypothetical protein